MINCPNKSLPSWKKLHSLGPDISNYIWNKLAGEISDDGKPITNIDRFNRILKSNNGNYKDSYLEFLGLTENDITKEELTGDTIPALDQILSENDKALLEDLNQLDRIAEIKRKAIIASESKLEYQIKRKVVKSESEIEKREDFIEKLNSLEAEEAMILFTWQTASSTNKIYKEWLDVKKKLQAIREGKLDKSIEEVLTADMLYNWRDFLSASDTIAKKNDIKKLYDVLGLQLTANNLSEYYGRLHKDFENELLKDYDSLTSEEKSRISKEDYLRSKQYII